MNKGKAKCDVLKKVRKGVADKLGIDLHQQECTFEGNCRSTCPKCKQEEELLNRELLKRAAGLGLGAVASLSLVGCTGVSAKGTDLSGDVVIKQTPGIENEAGSIGEETKEETINELSGDVTYIPEVEEPSSECIIPSESEEETTNELSGNEVYEEERSDIENLYPLAGVAEYNPEED